ncbi:unnamed protein product, partial [Urochloa humidicola]
GASCSLLPRHCRGVDDTAASRDLQSAATAINSTGDLRVHLVQPLQLHPIPLDRDQPSRPANRMLWVAEDDPHLTRVNMLVSPNRWRLQSVRTRQHRSGSSGSPTSGVFGDRSAGAALYVPGWTRSSHQYKTTGAIGDASSSSGAWL